MKPLRRVKAEMARRGLKTGDLARAIGYKTDSLTNLLGGNMRSQAAQNRIEEVLGMPIWSTPEEFIARLDTPEKITAYRRSVMERACGQMAALENFGQELQQITAKLGLTIVVVQFDGSPKSPFWGSGDVREPFHMELVQARAGQFDSAQMNDGSYFCFYHVSDLAKALTVLKHGIEQCGLLQHARIFFHRSGILRLAHGVARHRRIDSALSLEHMNFPQTTHGTRTFSREQGFTFSSFSRGLSAGHRPKVLLGERRDTSGTRHGSERPETVGKNAAETTARPETARVQAGSLSPRFIRLAINPPDSAGHRCAGAAEEMPRAYRKLLTTFRRVCAGMFQLATLSTRQIS